MGEDFGSACLLLTPERAAALGGACLAVALLLVAVIGVGFGLLRSWYATPAGRGLRSQPAIDGDGGLLGAWRLYRQLSRTAGDNSAPGILSPMVPGQVVEQK
jgi:hypothetical protein